MKPHPKNPANNIAPDVIFSEAALYRAWRIVRGQGNTPGIDGMDLKTFESQLPIELTQLQREILTGSYQPKSVKRFYVPKPSGKNRPLSLWAIRDRVAQRVVHDYLTPIVERIFLPCSYGFRPGRSPHMAAEAVKAAYHRRLRWVVDTDIAHCFDSIPIDLLLGQVQRVVPSSLVIKLIEQWLYTPILQQDGEKAGVSQGSVISPQLANLYLHRFDQMIFSALTDVFLVRFADDFVILCRERPDAEWALQVAQHALASLRLSLNPDKTRVVHFQEGFQFLGFTFKGSRYRPTTLPEITGE